MFWFLVRFVLRILFSRKFVCNDVYEEWSIILSSSSEDKQSLIHKGGGVGEDGVQVSSNKVIEFVFGIGVSSKL